jgi:hypothetical protein
MVFRSCPAITVAGLRLALDSHNLFVGYEDRLRRDLLSENTSGVGFLPADEPPVSTWRCVFVKVNRDGETTKNPFSVAGKRVPRSLMRQAKRLARTWDAPIFRQLAAIGFRP